MHIKELLWPDDEKPLDRLTTDGGYVGIFRTIGCIGDSLSSGEFQTDGFKERFHDYYDYSWGQYLARMAGCQVLNFSKGGMTAKEYVESFAGARGYWDAKVACQAYTIALGANDLFGWKMPLGSVSDINLEDYTKNAPTFAGYYGQIIQRLRIIQPKARFFLITMPKYPTEPEDEAMKDAHQALLYEIMKLFPFTYVIDLRKYGPIYDEEFKKHFYLYGHMNAAGYLLTAQMIVSYMDYIIRHDFGAFRQVGLIGTAYYNDELDI